jgi:Zn-dependent protease
MSTSVDTPFGRGWRLGRVRGIAVIVHWSVAAILLLVTMVLSASELPARRAGASPLAYWVVGAVSAVVFVAAIVMHELAHAMVARHYGMRVERMTIWMLGGLTELDGEPPSPKAAAFIAGVGPLTTLGLAVAFATGAGLAPESSLVSAALVWLAAVSIVIAVFNLLPAAPLDGGRILHAIVWRVTGNRGRADDVASGAGRIAGFALVTLGLIDFLLGNAGGIWLALIGWFIVNAARGEQFASRTARLTGLVAADVMTPATTILPSWQTAGGFSHSFDPHAAGQPAFPVVDLDGRTVGVLTTRDVVTLAVPAASELRLGDYCARRRPAALVEPKTPLKDVLLAIHQRGGVAVVVDEAKHPIGLVGEDAVLRILATRQPLAGSSR